MSYDDGRGIHFGWLLGGVSKEVAVHFIQRRFLFDSWTWRLKSVFRKEPRGNCCTLNPGMLLAWFQVVWLQLISHPKVVGFACFHHEVYGLSWVLLLSFLLVGWQQIDDQLMLFEFLGLARSLPHGRIAVDRVQSAHLLSQIVIVVHYLTAYLARALVALILLLFCPLRALFLCLMMLAQKCFLSLLIDCRIGYVSFHQFEWLCWGSCKMLIRLIDICLF